MSNQAWLKCCAIAVVLTLFATTAHAQFAQPTTPPSIPNPVQTGLNRLPSDAMSQDIQKIMLLRALQQRSGRGGGGGVRTGVPQFIPFGNNFMPNAMLQPQQPVAAGGESDDKGGKTVAERRAEHEAAREEKKRKARERAEQRKAERAKAANN